MVKLLPDTAFLGYVPTIDPSHPSARLNNGEQPMAGPSSLHMNRTRTNIDPAMPIFTDPHFLAAAHTFQDHICSGWMSAAQKDKVKQFQDGIKVLDASGGVGLAAPWKDEIWERETREEALFQTAAGNSRNGNLTRLGLWRFLAANLLTALFTALTTPSMKDSQTCQRTTSCVSETFSHTNDTSLRIFSKSRKM